MLATSVAVAGAQDFQIVKVASVAGATVDQLKPKTIFFNDHRVDETSDKGAFIRFDEWSAHQAGRSGKFLNLFPSFTEGMVHKIIDGSKKEVKDELQMYVTEARFMLSRPAASDRPQDASPRCRSSRASIRRSSIEVIKPSDVSVLEGREVGRTTRTRTAPGAKAPASPPASARATSSKASCRSASRSPTSCATASKKLSDTIEFESEMRLLSAADVDEAGLQKLTGVNTPVAGVLEQNMFYVNQVMRFGKLIAVFQPNPADAKSTIATVMIALAVGSSTLEQKKKYQDVPVLRNLVPSQVLLGNSSFNTGNSISAGLPSYVRNRIKAIAGILDRG